jgi:hypothetical protein
MTKRELPKELYKWSKKMTRMKKKKLKMIINCTILNQNPQLIKRTMMKKKDMKKSKSTITSSSLLQTKEDRLAV